MPVNSEIFRIYRHLFYGSPLNFTHLLREVPSYVNFQRFPTLVNSQESVNRV